MLVLKEYHSSLYCSWQRASIRPNGLVTKMCYVWLHDFDLKNLPLGSMAAVKGSFDSKIICASGFCILWAPSCTCTLNVVSVESSCHSAGSGPEPNFKGTIALPSWVYDFSLLFWIYFQLLSINSLPLLTGLFLTSPHLHVKLTVATCTFLFV